MKLFWERGYEGTSFDDLVATMGISPSSFYYSFGCKERLYQEATEAYMARSGEWFGGALGAAPVARGWASGSEGYRQPRCRRGASSRWAVA